MASFRSAISFSIDYICKNYFSMRIILLSLLCASFFTYSFAQPAIQWKKCFGGSDDDEAYSVIQTKDGGYIVAGTTYSNDSDVAGNHGDYDVWIVKLFSNGNVDWKQTYGGTGDDEAYSIQQTSDNGYI